MDAITQLIESYISRRAPTDPSALCLQGIALAAPAIARPFTTGTTERRESEWRTRRC